MKKAGVGEEGGDCLALLMSGIPHWTNRVEIALEISGGQQGSFL